MSIERVRKQGFHYIAGRVCPLCGANALCVLPLYLLLVQPDDTNIVCHPLLGGCNHGFEASVTVASSTGEVYKP